MVMGLASRLSLASHSDSESFLAVHALFSQDVCQREGFWDVVWHMVTPFDLSRTLPVGGGLLVPCSLPGPPGIKQLMQMSLWRLARAGSFSRCAPPNTSTAASSTAAVGASSTECHRHSPQHLLTWCWSGLFACLDLALDYCAPKTGSGGGHCQSCPCCVLTW